MSEHTTLLTTEELEKLKQLDSISRNITFEYGNIAISQKMLDKRLRNVDDSLEALSEKQNELARELEEKYGPGSVNIQEGTFTPINSTKQ